jgi:antitoxin ParD1/3/4
MILTIYQILVLLLKFKEMKNTSISLGNYFDQFVQTQVAAGRYKNVSEVIRAGLRLLENEESKVIALKNAIQQGIDSGIANDFDPEKHLQHLKDKRKSNGSI